MHFKVEESGIIIIARRQVDLDMDRVDFNLVSFGMNQNRFS